MKLEQVKENWRKRPMWWKISAFVFLIIPLVLMYMEMTNNPNHKYKITHQDESVEIYNIRGDVSMDGNCITYNHGDTKVCDVKSIEKID